MTGRTPTGQLVKISNHLDHNKNRGYQCDALGRLQRATGGQNVNWVQRYEYDRYGNRSNVFSYPATDFVNHFYQSTVGHAPADLNSILTNLQTAYAQGPSQFLTAMQNMGDQLFNSTEYLNHSAQISNSDYVKELYRAYLYREADGGGLAAWTAVLDNNQGTRADVRNGFAWSAEFQLKVKGIAPYPQPSGPVPPDGIGGLGFDASSNRIANSGWNYDAAGNQTRGLAPGSSTVSQRYQYDAANRLVKVKNDSGTTIAIYTYGDSNERLISQDGDENSNYRTYYVSEGGAVVGEYSETPSSPTVPQWSKSYVYLGGCLLSTLTPNGSGGEAIEYDHPDRLGTRLVTNPANGSSFEQVTLPFGTALESESSGQTNRRFTSYDRSTTTKLDHAVNRHYDPQQGRFTQVDPAEMNATDLQSPQTLNLYAYCTNDPINHTDPSGLGFFSFLKKVFKWIVVALTVAVAVLTVIYAPYLFATVTKAVLGIIGAIANAASSVLNALGLTKAGNIFSIISAGASFGLSLGALYEKGGMIAKNILKAIQQGATLASRTLSALGHTMIAQVLDLASSTLGFVSDGLKKVKGKFKFHPSDWQIYKFARRTAERVATLAGETRIAGFLNVLGLAEDTYTLFQGILHFNRGEKGGDIYAPAKKWGEVIKDQNQWEEVNRHVRLEGRIERLGGLVGRVNTAFGRIDRAVALAR